MTDKDKSLWDESLDTEEKLDLLISSLTLDEKMHMISSGSEGVERLGVPDMKLGGEAAHGVEARNDQNGVGEPDITTSFPQPIGMSSSWDKDAIRKAGRIVGKEARIDYNKRKWGGVSRWAPTVDLLRDPRWGRNEEAYGEDPVQTGAMAAAYIEGIQGDDPDHLTAAATLKHFYANNTEIGRGWKNSSISPRNKFELYIEPFRRCIEDGGAEGIMTAYNRINGVQGLFNREVNDLLKCEFGLTHAVSDGGAMELTASYSHARGMDAETAAESLKAGVDALSGRPDAVYAAISEAYDLGLLTEEDLDRAIRNVYRTKIRLGLFSEAEADGSLGSLCSDEAHAACKALTDASIVLLKNDGILPLDDDALKDAVLIGPVGDKWYQDWYGGEAPEHISLFDGLKSVLKEHGLDDDIRYVDGCDAIRIKTKDGYFSADSEGKIRLSDKGDVYVLEDWGEDSYTLRCESTGKYMISSFPGGSVSADADRIFSWFDLEVFRIEKVRGADDEVILRDRFGNRLYADKDGYIVTSPEGGEGLDAVTFEIETVRNGIDEAVACAASAKTVILALGHNPMVNAKEQIDRSTIEFIPYQQKLFDEIYKVNRNIAVVLLSDYPFAVNELNEKAGAIIWSATGSQCMGRSVADALAGDVHPAGRLTQTWFASDSDLPDIDDYDIIGKGRTYRYFEGDVLYPFGYGLTLTTFELSNLKIETLHGLSGAASHKKREANPGACTHNPGQPSGVYDVVRKDDRILNIEVTVTNTGNTVSDEVVQIYAKAKMSRVKRPVKQLIGFERVKDIAPREARTVTLNIPVRELAYYDVISESLIIEDGLYEICAGASSSDPGVSQIIRVDGVKAGLRDMSRRIKADHYDEEEGTQIVEGLYGFSALMAKAPGVYEPPKDGHISVTYAGCLVNEDAKILKIHGMAPSDATVSVYMDDIPVGSLTLNTREYERKLFEDMNRMPRAVADDKLRKESWPLLWADIHIPLDMDKVSGISPDTGHVIRIEADGPFKYDWFMLAKADPVRGR